jgi:hypothetical protein
MFNAFQKVVLLEREAMALVRFPIVSTQMSGKSIIEPKNAVFSR